MMAQPALFASDFKKPAPDDESSSGKDKSTTKENNNNKLATPIRTYEKAKRANKSASTFFENSNGSNKVEQDTSFNISKLRLATPLKDCDKEKSGVSKGNSSINKLTEEMKCDGDDGADSPVLWSKTSKRCLKNQQPRSKRARVESGSGFEYIPSDDKCSDESVSDAVPSDEKSKLKETNACDLKATQIIDALQKSDTNPDLIGDYSRPHTLPIIKGRHNDLQSITPDTLASLINGRFKDQVGSFKIIDSRFPYEYEGGHIKGAINIFHHSALIQELMSDQENTPPTSSKDGKSNQILIFHCEFSSERAPSLCRFLRKTDREFNAPRYPQLYHPEVYLLEGGYKAFFESHKELCTPQQYLPMRSKDHQEQMRTCQSKRKKMEKEASKCCSKFRNRS